MTDERVFDAMPGDRVSFIVHTACRVRASATVIREPILHQLGHWFRQSRIEALEEALEEAHGRASAAEQRERELLARLDAAVVSVDSLRDLRARLAVESECQR